MARRDRPGIAVFIDFENIVTAAESRYYTLDLQRLFAELGRRGRLVLKRAYGDWSRFTKYREELLRHGVDLVQIYSYGHKIARNRADVRMAIDAMEVLFTRPEIQIFAIISGDSDFSSLITRLREHGKFVIGVGVQGATSDLIPALCDEFVYYDTLIVSEGGAAPTPAPPSTPEGEAPAPAPEAMGAAERYRRYLEDWGFALLEATVRRMGLTRLFEALRTGASDLTLTRWLEQANWEGLDLEENGRQELSWLLLLSPALSFGALPPSSVTPIQGLRVTSLKRFIEAAESGMIRFLGMANWPLEPEALALLLGLPIGEVESILRGMVREGPGVRERRPALGASGGSAPGGRLRAAAGGAGRGPLSLRDHPLPGGGPGAVRGGDELSSRSKLPHGPGPLPAGAADDPGPVGGACAGGRAL